MGQIYDPSELLSNLNDLHKEGYIFRGHKDSRYQLQPNGFWLETLGERAKIFPHDETIIKGWFKSQEIVQLINLKHASFSQINHFFHYLIHLMRYGYEIYRAYENDLGSAAPKDEEIIAWHEGSKYWSEEKTFIHLVTNLWISAMRDPVGLRYPLIFSNNP